MATRIPKLIDADRLYFEGNVRSPECQHIPAMVESFRRHGWKDNHPLVLSEKADGRCLVLIGNRRGLGLLWLQENEVETYNRVLPGGKVPAIVHKGLTQEEEIDLRIDHSSDEDRIPLDEWSIFLAIQQLVRARIDTQEQIAIKLGLFKVNGKQAGEPRREYVQVRVNLARLPQFVQDEIRKLTLDKDSTPVRWTHVARLYKAYNAEYIKHPNADGPEFVKVWKEVMTPPQAADATDEGETAEPKELSPAEAVKRSQSANSQGLKCALLVVTRQSDSDLAAIDAAMLEGETATQILADVKEYMGEKDFSQLVDVATKQGNDRRESDKVQEEAMAEASA